MPAADVAVVLRFDFAAAVGLNAAALGHPGAAQARQALFHLDAGGGIGVGARWVIDTKCRLTLGQRTLAEGHAEVGVTLRARIDLAAGADRPGGDLGNHQVLAAGDLVHNRLLSTGAGWRHLTCIPSWPGKVRAPPA